MGNIDFSENNTSKD